VISLIALALPQAALASQNTEPQWSTASQPGKVVTVAGGGYTDGWKAVDAPLPFPADVDVDELGNLYFSDVSDRRVRKIDNQGVLSTVAGTGDRGIPSGSGRATEATFTSINSVTVSWAGDLYITDNEGHVVRRVDKNGHISTFAGNGQKEGFTPGLPATATAIESPSDVAVGRDGTVYIAESVNGRVLAVDTDGIVRVVAGSGTLGFSGDGGPALAAQLNYPDAIDIGPTGDLYITDTGNYRIRRVDSAGIITTFAGNGSFGFDGDGGPATSATIGYPTGLDVDESGDVFISFNYNRVRRVDSSGTITTVAGTGLAGFNGDGPASSTSLNSPNGLATKDGVVYLADLGNNRIRKITPDGALVTVAGNGDCCFLGDGLIATEAALAAGDAMVAPDGALLIADKGHQRVRRVDPVTRRITTIAGNGDWGRSGEGGPATAAQVGDPTDVEAGPDGSIYIASSTTHRILKVSPEGVLSRVAGIGIDGKAGDGGPAIAAQLKYPWGIDLDDAGNLYIADTGNGRIRKVDANGIITTLAGGLFKVSPVPDDGLPASVAAINQPFDVEVGPSGDVYVTDVGNDRIVRIHDDPADVLPPVLKVVAGTGTEGSGGDGGPALEATLRDPSGLAFDPDGDLYFADSMNQRIRVITTEGDIYSVAGTGAFSYRGDGGPHSGASFKTPGGISFTPWGDLLVTDQGSGRIRLLRAPFQNYRWSAETSVTKGRFPLWGSVNH
jgi:sugar lactone lactonase YvrE